MSANLLDDLFAAARAADAACVGCALLAAGESRPEWLVAERADGLRVRIDGVAAESPAVAAVLALDLSEGAVAARELARNRAEALTYLLTLGTPLGVAIRIADDATTTLQNDLNDRFAAALAVLNAQVIALGGAGVDLGALAPTRILAADVLAYVMANPTAGDPVSPPPPKPKVPRPQPQVPRDPNRPA